MNWRVSSCCCFSLRTGTLILGYLTLIGSILSTLACIIILADTRNYVEAIFENDPPAKPLTPEQFDAVVNATKITTAVGLVIVLLGGMLATSLLVGVYKEKPGLIKLNLILYIIGCVLGALACLLYLIGSFAKPVLFMNFISSSLVLALHVYYTMVIHSYRLELLEGRGLKRDGPNVPRQF